MNISFHFTHAARGLLARRLSLMLLPALVSEAAANTSAHASHRPERSQPYLRVCLPPPLRFDPPPVPPEVADPTVVMGPPNPGGPFEEIANANRESARSEPTPASSAPPPQDVQTSPSSPGSPSAPSAPSATSDTRPSAPLPILPDDTPQQIHSEDLLPYFRAPSSNPVPPLPASSATYRQQ